MVLLSKVLEARARGNEALEDSLLDELDSIWYSLSEESIDKVSSAIIRQYLSQQENDHTHSSSTSASQALSGRLGSPNRQPD